MKELSPEELNRIAWAHLSSLPYFRAMLRAVEHGLYARMELNEPILDVGAGDGHFAAALFRDEAVLGIDPWWQPLSEAAQRQCYPALVQAQGSALPLPAASFATAISNSVLEHIPNIQAVLDDTARALKPGGTFIFTVPNARFKTELWGMQMLKRLGLGRLAPTYSRIFNKIARHYNLDMPEVWLKRLEQAGFAQVEYHHYFPLWAMQMLERGHVGGLPNLLWKKLFGKWVLFPHQQNPFLHFRKIRPLLTEPFCEDGSCTLYIARRDG